MNYSTLHLPDSPFVSNLHSILTPRESWKVHNFASCNTNHELYAIFIYSSNSTHSNLE